MTACCPRFLHPAKQTSRKDNVCIARLPLCRLRTTSFALELKSSATLGTPTISIDSVRSNFRTLRAPQSLFLGPAQGLCSRRLQSPDPGRSCPWRLTHTQRVEVGCRNTSAWSALSAPTTLLFIPFPLDRLRTSEDGVSSHAAMMRSSTSWTTVWNVTCVASPVDDRLCSVGSTETILACLDALTDFAT